MIRVVRLLLTYYALRGTLAAPTHKITVVFRACPLHLVNGVRQPYQCRIRGKVASSVPLYCHCQPKCQSFQAIQPTNSNKMYTKSISSRCSLLIESVIGCRASTHIPLVTIGDAVRQWRWWCVWRVRLFSHYLENQIHHAFSVRVFSAAPCTTYSDRSFCYSTWQAQVICITSYNVVYSICILQNIPSLYLELCNTYIRLVLYILHLLLYQVSCIVHSTLCCILYGMYVNLAYNALDLG